MKHSKTNKNSMIFYLLGFLLLVLILGLYYNNSINENFLVREKISVVKGDCSNCPRCTKSCTYNEKANTSTCIGPKTCPKKSDEPINNNPPVDYVPKPFTYKVRGDCSKCHPKCTNKCTYDQVTNTSICEDYPVDSPKSCTAKIEMERD